MKALRCVVMSVDMVPVSIIPSHRALLKSFLGRVNIMEVHPNVAIRTVDTAYPAPSVVMLTRYVRLPDFYYGAAGLSLRNLKQRDAFTCQYCGRNRLNKKEFWTKDHIFPVSRGGENRWNNIVLSCNICNNIKGDRTPEEAEMELLREPTVPTKWHIELLRKVQ